MMVPCPAAVPLQDTASTWQTQRGSRLPVQVSGQYVAWRGGR